MMLSLSVSGSSDSDLLEDLLQACDLLSSFGSHESPQVDPVDAGSDREVNNFDSTCDVLVIAVFDNDLKLLLWLERLLVQNQLPELESALAGDQRAL